MERERKVGDNVVYVDEQGKPHNALITNWWGDTCCNLLFVVDDTDKRDPYGNQIERRSSCSHRSVVQAPGKTGITGATGPTGGIQRLASYVKPGLYTNRRPTNRGK